MKSTIIKVAVLLLMLSTHIVRAQEKAHTSVSVKPMGAIAISYNPGSNSEFLNFGGPGIRLDHKDFSLAFHMFPSIRYFNGDVNDAKDAYRTKTQVTTILGCGPQIGYKKIAIVLPFYYSANNNVWIMSAGIGYKF